MAIKDIRTKDEIIISVKRQRGGDGTRNREKPGAKGRIKKSRSPESLSRRKLSAASGLIFYDLAQIRSGSDWITKNVSISPSVSLIYNGGFPGDPQSYDITPAEPPDSAYYSILTNLLPSNPAEYKTTFRRVNLTDAAAFPILVNSEFANTAPGANWTEAGLNLTSEQREVFIVQNSDNDHFGGFDLSNPANNKVTSIFDQNAPPVPFALAAKANIYLLPSIPQLSGNSETDEGGGTTRYAVFGLIHRFKPRYFSEPDAITESDFPPDNSEALTRASAVSPVRSFYYDFTGFTPSSLQSGGFPHGSVNFSIRYQGNFGAQTGRTLYAIIEQNGQFFYIWSGD